ncbi:MAG: sensor histidine kinase [Elainella sp.]
MVDFSQLLGQKADQITEAWIAAVERDRQISTTDQLSHQAIRDHIPYVLQALTTVLSQVEESDVETIARASLQHGLQRAEQGFEPTEIAREYHLLRATILQHLRAGLLQATAEEVLRAVSLINAVVDSALAECFRSYVNQRLQELERLQHQLNLTNQELQRLEHTSQENLSHLAHELKTPLTSIIGYSELFLRQQRNPVKDSMPNLEHVERVLRNGRQLLRLINDALELSRSDAGQLQLRLTPTDVRQVIEAAVELMQPLASQRHLDLVLDCDQAPAEVMTDALRLQQVLTNLVSNAIRYTETGKVLISCRVLNDQQWLLAVSDTGVGISPEDQAKVFNPYFRVPALDQSFAPDSTGLGLAIVVRLVKLLQGEITLESEVGIGSTFMLIFPLAVRGWGGGGMRG